MPEEKLVEWYEQNKTFGNLGPAERTRKQDPGLDRMQDLSSAARADRGKAVREPEPNNCQSLNAGCGSPAVFVFFVERAQLDKLRSECRKACIEQFMLKMSADGAYRIRPAGVAFLRTARENYLLYACMLLLQKVEIQTRTLLRINIASQG